MNIWMGLVDRSVPDRFYEPLPVVKPEKVHKAIDNLAQYLDREKTERAKRAEIVANLIQLATCAKQEVSQSDALEAKRIELGLKQCEFAKVLGIMPKHYIDIKAGRRKLCYRAARRAYALGVDADVLL